MWAQIKSYLMTMLRAGLAIGFGIFLATVEVEGRTPWEHLQRAWKRHGWSSLEDVKSSFRNAVLSITSSDTGLARPSELQEASYRPQLRVGRDSTLAEQ